MIGMVFTSVEVLDDELIFTSENKIFKFHHIQDCCETVNIEDVCGDLEDLRNHPILLAEEVDGVAPADFDYTYCESYTWTFYKFATIKGSVTVRWLGESNGYYSEGVDLSIIDKQNHAHQ